jgi:putative transposase
VWNWGLGERKADYENRVKPARERGETISGISAFDQINAWNKAKVEIAPWACEHSSRIPEHALTALDKAYKAWWAALKSGRRAGPPRFKAWGKGKESFTTHGAIKVDPTGITLPRIGRLRIKGSTRRVQGKILTATVSRTADRWFLSLAVERQIANPLAPLGGPVGIDVGLKQSLVLSTGEVIQGPRALKMSLRKLRRAQKAVSRSQRNSARRKVKVVKVARIHARVAHVRGNWLHGVSDRLTREHTVIGHENLNIRGLSSRKSHQGRPGLISAPRNCSARSPTRPSGVASQSSSLIVSIHLANSALTAASNTQHSLLRIGSSSAQPAASRPIGT